MASSIPALSYHEPSIQKLLVLSSFFLLLNIVNYSLDKILYCGLIGQILLGILYGVPGTDWLPLDVQNTVMQLGYIGLILVVYEGGLSTNMTTLKSNLALSSIVATIGITIPVALSFILLVLLPITPLQAFAAGAALCSTSLGTTFTVLTTSGLTETRLGIVLTSAAMMDDVVGLVMVQVISDLGQGEGFEVGTVLRPIFVSIGFAVVLAVGSRWVVGPAVKLAMSKLRAREGRLASLLDLRETAFVLHTAVLVGLVTGATYAGTSGLFAAYLAGTSVTWMSDAVLQADSTRHQAIQHSDHAQEGNIPGSSLQASGTVAGSNVSIVAERLTTGRASFEQYYSSVVERMLKPFFFASIGFSIPVTKMFAAPVIWRGIVYSILMIIGKLACGLCLVRFASASTGNSNGTSRRLDSSRQTKCKQNAGESQPATSIAGIALQELPSTTAGDTALPTIPQETEATPGRATANTSRKRSSRRAPLSLYPAAILGSAMVARGEIGFLISAVAESKGIYGASDGPSELFLVVTWAILLCTIIGPVAVGLLVKRVKRLQEAERKAASGKRDPLGKWGVVATI